MRPISVNRLTNKLLVELVFAALIVITVPVVCYVLLTGELPRGGDFPHNNAPSQI